MGQHRQRLALAMFVLQTGQRLLALGLMAEAYHGRVGASPRERRLADLRPRGALALPRRCLGARDATAVGHDILHAREALDGMDCIQPPQAQARTDAWDRAPQGARGGLGRLGRFEHAQVPSAEPMILVGHQGEIDCHTLLHCGVGQPLGDAVAVRLVGALLASRGQGILPLGLVEMPEPCRTCAPQGYPPPPQGAGGPQAGRRDVGRWEHAAAEPYRKLLCVDRIVFRFATMEGLPRQRMTEHNRQPCTGPEVGTPGPREETCDPDDHILSIRRHGLEQWCGAGRPMAVHEDLSISVQDAEGHGARV